MPVRIQTWLPRPRQSEARARYAMSTWGSAGYRHIPTVTHAGLTAISCKTKHLT